MMKKANNIVRIPTSLNGKFFKYWFDFLKPIHKLTNREIDVLAAFVKHRYELSKSIKDPEILDMVTMSKETKKKIREECNITAPYFQVIMEKLRKNNVIVDGKIQKKLLPKINEDMGSSTLIIHFEIQ